MLTVCSCVLAKTELVAVLAICSSVFGEEGAGSCAGCLAVCARKEGASRCAGCLLVCGWGKRELDDVLAVCSFARVRGSWSL